MKDSAWYNKLWQNKMQELPLQEDANAAWQKMQGLLDKNMPVNNPVSVPKPGRSWGYVFSVIAVAVIIAALLYFAGSYMLASHNKINKRNNKNTKSYIDSTKNAEPYKNENRPANDSLSGIKRNSSMAVKDSVAATKNPSAQTKNGAAVTQNGSVVNSGNYNGHKNTGNGSSSNYNSLIPAKRNAHLLRTQTNRLQQQANASTTPQGGNTNHSPQKGHKSAADSVAASITNPAGNLPVKSPVIGSSSYNKNIDSASKASTSGGNDIKNPAEDNVAKNSTSKFTNKTKAAAKTAGNSKFELGLKIGVNSKGSFTPSSQNSNFYGKSPVDAYLGINATYYISPKVGIGAGLNILSPKIISGSYSNTNLRYITIGDSSKKITHNTGKITISGSRKLYTVDVPVMVTYKLNDIVSFNAGPVIGIPVKQVASKNNLNLLTNSSDTTALKQVNPYVSNTTIDNKVNLSFSGGVRLHVKRIYFDAGYQQGISPYTISSGLGSSKIYYHTFQFGIGYQLFKPKKK